MVHRPLRIAAIPERHVYVRHLQPTRGRPWINLSDPPDRPWWPPARLDPGWIDANADRFDVFHVHFGFDAVTPPTLRDVCLALRRHGRPLVYTAHDLRNPHHRDAALHREQIAVWTAHADAVLTLTHGAAAELRERWDVAPIVVEHPHVVPLDEIAWRRERRPPRPRVPRVGLHLKSLRPNMAALPVLDVLGRLPDVVRCEVLVNVHRDVVDPNGAKHDPAVVGRLATLERAGRIRLRVHDYYDAAAFLDYLAALDVSVLPYRFGTHSDWLEACRDLAVATVASDCGYYGEQGATATYVCNEIDGLRPDTLIRAVDLALRDTSRPVSVSARRAQRARVARVHADLYRALVHGQPVAAAS